MSATTEQCTQGRPELLSGFPAQATMIFSDVRCPSELRRSAMLHDVPEGKAQSLWSRRPRIRSLSTIQSEFVLTRNHVGQLSFILSGKPELLPLHYVYAGGRIVTRTSFGPKCDAWLEQPSVVFGVEEIGGLFDWRSVLVHGTARILSVHGTRDERSDYWRAVDVVRSLIPDALRERDPTPERRVLLEILPTEISGREASTHFLSRGSP
jgi:nitroimidazol reductase NimA-like FMN-containing flavoprotein (pyridoxamine 5'-phosphate oxidase superfamily)